MTTQMLYSVLTIQYGKSDARAKKIISQAMENGYYFITTATAQDIVINTNSGMPAEFRIESA